MHFGVRLRMTIPAVSPGETGRWRLGAGRQGLLRSRAQRQSTPRIHAMLGPCALLSAHTCPFPHCFPSAPFAPLMAQVCPPLPPEDKGCRLLCCVGGLAQYLAHSRCSTNTPQ